MADVIGKCTSAWKNHKCELDQGHMGNHESTYHWELELPEIEGGLYPEISAIWNDEGKGKEY